MVLWPNKGSGIQAQSSVLSVWYVWSTVTAGINVFIEVSCVSSYHAAHSKPNVVTTATWVAHTPGGAAKVARVSTIKRTTT